MGSRGNGGPAQPRWRAQMGPVVAMRSQGNPPMCSCCCFCCFQPTTTQSRQVPVTWERGTLRLARHHHHPSMSQREQLACGSRAYILRGSVRTTAASTWGSSRPNVAPRYQFKPANSHQKAPTESVIAQRQEGAATGALCAYIPCLATSEELDTESINRGGKQHE